MMRKKKIINVARGWHLNDMSNIKSFNDESQHASVWAATASR